MIWRTVDRAVTTATCPRPWTEVSRPGSGRRQVAAGRRRRPAAEGSAAHTVIVTWRPQPPLRPGVIRRNGRYRPSRGTNGRQRISGWERKQEKGRSRDWLGVRRRVSCRQSRARTAAAAQRTSRFDRKRASLFGLLRRGAEPRHGKGQCLRTRQTRGSSSSGSRCRRSYTRAKPPFSFLDAVRIVCRALGRSAEHSPSASYVAGIQAGSEGRPSPSHPRTIGARPAGGARRPGRPNSPRASHADVRKGTRSRDESWCRRTVATVRARAIVGPRTASTPIPRSRPHTRLSR